MLLDYDLQLVAKYHQSLFNYIIDEITINGSPVKFTETQRQELIEDILEAEVFFEDDNVVILE